MKLQPTPKKIFNVKERTQLSKIDALYRMHLRYRNCTNLIEFKEDGKNRFSVADAIITSGDSQVLIEHKDRSTVNVWQYTTSLIQADKYNNLINVGEFLNCKALYVVEYVECICIFQLNPKEKQYTDYIVAQKTNDSIEEKVKGFYHLSFDNVLIVITKKDFNQKEVTKEQLLEYRRRKRKEFYGENY